MKTLVFAALGLTVLSKLAGAEAPTAFDVASVKPSSAQFASGLKTDPGRLVMTNASLSEIIQKAYGVSDLRISGTPTQLGRFDIDGRTTNPRTRSELLRMLQTLLADRFKLTLHRERKELPVGTLVVSKNQLKLQNAITEGDPSITLHPGKSAENVNSVVITGKTVTLPFVADYLSNRLRRVVVDRTELTGAFDFNLEISVDRREFIDPSVPEQDNVAHLLGDLLSKLGLQMESQRALVEILVVDHAEKPSED